MEKKIEVNKGDTYSRLTIIKEVEKKIDLVSGKPSRQFECSCICGNCKIILLASLRQGLTKSCGCIDMETKTTHKLYNTRIYGVWSNMKYRCNKKSFSGYKNYGGRGITYSKKWERFEGFYADMGATYKKGLTIDRIDNNGNYCKENCRWASIKEQQRNRRITLKYNGISIAEWCDKLDLSYSSVFKKIKYRGYSCKKALGL